MNIGGMAHRDVFTLVRALDVGGLVVPFVDDFLGREPPRGDTHGKR